VKHHFISRVKIEIKFFRIFKKHETYSYNNNVLKLYYKFIIYNLINNINNIIIIIIIIIFYLLLFIISSNLRLLFYLIIN